MSGEIINSSLGEQSNIFNFLILPIMTIASCVFLIDKSMRKKKSVIILTVVEWILITGAYIFAFEGKTFCFITGNSNFHTYFEKHKRFGSKSFLSNEKDGWTNFTLLNQAKTKSGQNIFCPPLLKFVITERHSFCDIENYSKSLRILTACIREIH